MAFQVSFEDEPIHKSRVDLTPYRECIAQGKASGKVVAITLETEDVKSTINYLRQAASKMGDGLRFDRTIEISKTHSKLRFKVTEKRKFSQEAIDKRKATMAKNGKKAGRKATSATKKVANGRSQVRKAS